MTHRTRTHQCAGRCGTAIPDSFYTCAPCWKRLPADLRQQITSAYRIRHTGADARRNHIAAMRDAHRWYLLHPLPGQAALVRLADGEWL